MYALQGEIEWKGESDSNMWLPIMASWNALWNTNYVSILSLLVRWPAYTNSGATNCISSNAQMANQNKMKPSSICACPSVGWMTPRMSQITHRHSFVVVVNHNLWFNLLHWVHLWGIYPRNETSENEASVRAEIGQKRRLTKAKGLTISGQRKDSPSNGECLT